MAEKNCFDMCVTGAVVKELLAPADKPGSTPGDAVFCFFVPFCFLFFVFCFFSVWSLFNTIFPLGLFFFILTADPTGHTLGSIHISIKRKSGVLFWKRDFKIKALDLHTGQAYDQKK